MPAQFLHSNLGHRSKGDIVEVTLSRAANVRLLDTGALAAYRNGRKHTYYGGLAKVSPTRIPVPRSGQWHLVIDLQGLRPGTIRHSVRVVPAAALRPLPPIQQSRQRLHEIAENLADAAPDPGVDSDRDFDVFISHASEDKDDVVRPLAQALRDRGLEVWYDEFTLKIGDSLRRKIDQGIARSRFGIVVLSPPFLAKGWPQYELDGLVTMSVSGKQSCCRSGTTSARTRSSPTAPRSPTRSR